jgi:hypothetical protein
MRIPFGIALLVALCLVAVNLPQASAGKQWCMYQPVVTGKQQSMPL